MFTGNIIEGLLPKSSEFMREYHRKSSGKCLNETSLLASFSIHEITPCRPQAC